MKEGTIELGHQRLAYREAGEAKAHPPFLCLHGAGGDRKFWTPLQAELKRHGIRSLALELPGHGQSPGPGCSAIEDYASIVTRFAEAYGLSQPVLAGHSMGGAVALSCALSSPGTWGGLALIGTGARLRIAPELLDGIHANFETTVELATEWAFSPSAPAALLEEGKKDLLAFSPDVLHGDYTACDRFDVMADLHKIDMPVLVVCGDEDRLTPPKYSRYLAENIPGARLEMVSGAGHMVMLERPVAVAHSMAGFLSGA